MEVGDPIGRICERIESGKRCRGDLQISAPTYGFTREADEIQPSGVLNQQAVKCLACGAFYHYDPDANRLTLLSS